MCDILEAACLYTGCLSPTIYSVRVIFAKNTVFTSNFELRGQTLNHSIWSVYFLTIYVINNK